MIPLTLILAALVLLIFWDTAAAETATQAIPVESDDTLSRRR